LFIFGEVLMPFVPFAEPADYELTAHGRHNSHVYPGIDLNFIENCVMQFVPLLKIASQGNHEYSAH
jgi:hypothetical protein